MLLLSLGKKWEVACSKSVDQCNTGLVLGAGMAEKTIHITKSPARCTKNGLSNSD